MKKLFAILLEMIPVISAPVSYLLIISKYDSDMIRTIITITMALAFFGFAFFFIGRKIAKEDRIVRFLGILDWLATLYVIAFYILVIFVFGL